MNTKWTRNLIWMSALFVVVLLTTTFARPAAADDYDPPGRVGRLNYLSGSVSFQPAGETDWVSGSVNRPMTTGDRLWADYGARAEMHLGSATIRLDEATGLSFLNLDDNGTQIQLTEGILNIRVRRLDRDEYFEVDTPNQAFSILQPGVYRVEVNEDGNSTLVTVHSGAGEVTGGGRTFSIRAGESGDFSGTDSLYADIFRSDGLDDFDRWSQDRDRRDDASRSARYVSRDVVGYEDLDDNGTWRSDPDYGDVWVPRVAAGWAPYRDGHWAWISPWGWTWVDDAPWGYAPFHYGRWVYAGNSWGWVPGPISVRPVYAPALVAFVGGPGFSLSVSLGGGRGGSNVGWFPLGPREVYVPGYNASREYVTRVNVSNTTVNNTTVINVYNNRVANNGRGGNRGNYSDVRYVNRSAPGGVTAVSQGTFTSAQPVGRAIVAVNQQQIASAPISSRAEFAPTRNSVFGKDAPRGNRVPQPPPSIENRTVVAKRPPPPPPVAFERQQQQLAAHPGQPLARNEVEGLRPRNVPAQQPQIRQAPPGRPAQADSNQPDQGRGNNRRGNNGPQNGGPAGIGANPNQPGNIPPGRGNGPDRSNRGQPGNIQPVAPPPPAAIPSAPPNEAPPGRNGRPDRPNRGQPENVQPTAPPPAAVPNPPAAAPSGRFGGRPDRPNRGQPGNVQPTAPLPPAATPPPPAAIPVPPAAEAPPGRNGRPDRPNRGQPETVRPTAPQPPAAAPPPAAVAPNPPAAEPAAGRNGRPDRPNRGQPENVPPPAPPPAAAPPPAPAPTPPPAAAAPTARNDRPERGGRGNQPPPAAPPATSANPAPPAASDKKDQPPANADDKKQQGNRRNRGDPAPN